MPKKIDNIPSPSEYTQYITKDGHLYVGIEATHSGFINKNNFFYIPTRMRDSVDTWISKYNKPVLKSHDLTTEPVGRVVKAIFKYTNEDAESVAKFLTSDDPKKETENWIKYIRDNKEIIADSENALGYIYLIARISDKDAIEKILDGRYKTVSVGAATDASICSACGANWSAGEVCEHEPFLGGADEDGNPLCFIAGNFEYREVSIVNNPADSQARIVDIYTEDEINTLLDSTSIEDSQKEYNKENNMPKDKNTNVNDATKEALEQENASLKKQVEDLTKEVESLKAKVKDFEDKLKAEAEVNKKLTDELKEVYFAKIADLMKANGKEVTTEEIKEKYGSKSLEQLKDLISIISELVIVDKDEKENVENKEEGKEESKTDENVEDKEKDLEDKKESVEDQTKERKTENTKIEIPEAVKRQAASIAISDGQDAANEFINNWIEKNLK